MSYTLSNLIVDCMTKIGKMAIREATGGSATTAVDSTLALLELEDDVYNGSYLFVIDTTDGLTPKGKFKKISDFVASTGTFTTATFTDAIGAGDKFGYITSSTYDLNSIIKLINIGLRQLGTISLVDTTTLNTATAQSEYPAAVEWKYTKPYRIDIQGKTGDADDNQWQETWAWEWIPATPGTTGLIVLREQPVASRDIRVWYEGIHPELVDYDDYVSETIHPQLALVASLESILFTKNAEANGSDDTITNLYNWASQQLTIEKENFRIWKPKKQVRGLVIGNRYQNDHVQAPE